MQGIYIYIPETNYVPREYIVAAILLLLCMVLMPLVSVLNLLYFYISTFRSIIIIIIIILPSTFIQGTHNYITVTNHVHRVYSFATVLYLQFVLHVTLFRP